MLGDMEIVHAAQRDAPTMRRLSVDLMASAHHREADSLRRLSMSSTSSSISQSSSPTFSSSLPNTHVFWPEKMSSLFRTTSLPVHEGSASAPIAIPTQRSVGNPDSKVPALIRSLSKGMDAFR